MSTQLTISEQRRDFLALIQGDGFKKQMALAMPKHMTPDRMMRVALTAMNKTPALYECHQDSIMAAMMDCSAMGLEPDGRNAYLLPYKDNKRGMICQLIVGYMGMIELAYRHPLVKGIRAKAVYEKDHFEYDEGLTPRLEHRPYEGEEDPGKLRYAYAICNLDGGGFTFVVLNRRQVMKAKSSSRGAGSTYSPWSTHEEAMWIKTAVRALAKFMPRSNELSSALDADDRHQTIDIESTMVKAARVGQRTAIEEAAQPAIEAQSEVEGAE